MTMLWWAAARALNTLYFVGSSLYCLLGYSSFANEQFIRPQLIPWLPGAVNHHHEFFWVTLMVTATTLVPSLRRGSTATRAATAGYLLVNVAVGMWLIGNPILATVGLDDRTLTLAWLFLLPPLALAGLDHLSVAAPAVRRIEDRHLFLMCAVASATVWLTYALLVPWYLPHTSGIDLGSTALGVAAGVSLTSHLLLFAIVYLLSACALGAVSFIRNPLFEYWVLCALSVGGSAFLLQRVVAEALSFDTTESWILSGGASVVLVTTWSGLTWRRSAQHVRRADAADDAAPQIDSIDLWFLPLTGGSRLVALVGVVAMPAIAAVLRSAVEQFDWNLLLQKLGVSVVWLMAFAASAELTRRIGGARLAGRTCGVIAAAMIPIGLAGVPTVSRLSTWSGDARLNPEFVLDRYSALDGSYHLVRGLLEARGGEHAEFYAFLKAHSTLGRVAAAPVDVSFVDAFAAAQRPPHVFLFIVDSLRPDYLSPYNPAVGFTPATKAFASEAVVFERAYTRYGSTGLSVPAIWSGGLLLHKQYVKPFAPMNALEKLLDGAGYRSYLSDDHLVTQLFRPSPSIMLLDERIQEMDHTMCATTRELQLTLDETRGDSRPVFAMTRPLQLHTARLVRNPRTSPEAYPGFEPNYAAQVEALDRCLGEFIDYLKQSGLYAESVVVLTSDHGESLGEDGRWGHGNALHPELLRIPLMIHLPAALASSVTADPSMLAFSTDITPTLYELAGQHPNNRGPLYGRSLFTRHDEPSHTRRGDAFLMSASYGPGYALLRRDGRELYIADAFMGVTSSTRRRPTAPWCARPSPTRSGRPIAR